MAVGVRELKAKLSEYLRRVREGEVVLVTDRGQVVAELGPPLRVREDERVSPALAALIRGGAVRPPTRRAEPGEVARAGDGSPGLPLAAILDLLDDTRGDR